MKSLLCVGGSHAGEVICVDDNADYIVMHERVDLTPHDFNQMIDRDQIPHAMPSGERCHYRVQKLQQANKTYEVLYIRDGSDLIGDLINGYRPQVGRRFVV